MVTLIKLGGSLITDKAGQKCFREETCLRLAQEIKSALAEKPQKIIIGHGSGSFGHQEAHQFQTHLGVKTAEDWIGFTRVAYVAAELNQLVAGTFMGIDLPVFRMPLSNAAISENKSIIDYPQIEILNRLLETAIIPLVYGDVVMDKEIGGTIASTEMIFKTITDLNKEIDKIILVGKVDGVLSDQVQLIPQISAQNFDTIRPMLKGSDSTDVTGGMLSKVEDMLALVSGKPGMVIQIINGEVEGRLQDSLLDKSIPATLIHND
ncbi:isopentenyl phosphate kinase [Anaerolineales bacterium]